jgi:hypothetical protein
MGCVGRVGCMGCMGCIDWGRWIGVLDVCRFLVCMVCMVYVVCVVCMVSRRVVPQSSAGLMNLNRSFPYFGTLPYRSGIPIRATHNF